MGEPGRTKHIWLGVIIAAVVVIVILAIVLGVVFGVKGKKKTRADLIIADTYPNSIAIKDGVIIAIGTAKEIIDKYEGKHTVTVSLPADEVMPGFIDGHAHPGLGGLIAHYSDGVSQLWDAETLDDLHDILSEFAQAHPDPAVLPTVIGMNSPYLDITRQLLDEHVDSERPVIIIAYDIHAAWANTAAFIEAGLLYPSEEMKAHVETDANGTATGRLYGYAGYTPFMPQLGAVGAILCHRTAAIAVDDEAMVELTGQVRETVKDILFKSLSDMAAMGITTVHAMDGDRVMLDLYDEMYTEGLLPVRIYTASSVLPIDVEQDLLEQTLNTDRIGKPSDMIRCPVAKFWLDGTIEAQSAVVVDSYRGTAETGTPIWDFDVYKATVAAADKLGLRVVTHCVGDGAVKMAFDAYEEVIEESGDPDRDRRWEIVHIELLHSDDLDRFAKNNIIAAMQPLHAEVDDGDSWHIQIPFNRLKDSFPWQTIREAGGKLLWGSDWPVVEPDVIEAIRYMVNERELAADGAKDQRQDIKDALAGYIEVAAFSEFAEDVKGVLEVGALADLVVISGQDILDDDAKPLLTVCNGEITYQAPEE